MGSQEFTRSLKVRSDAAKAQAQGRGDPTSQKPTGDKCYGSTTDSKPVSVGSTPTSPANYITGVESLIERISSNTYRNVSHVFIIY